MRLSLRLFVSAFAVLALPLVASAATPISGVVTNRTTGKPAAGDDVVLIRLAQGMQEATRTKTDARGNFTLEVPDDGLHLVRVTHDKANYFRPAPPGTQSVDIDVFNAAAHVKGVTTEADVMRIQTDASNGSLRIVENFFLKNESTPPLTQFSSQPFDFYLPDGAVVDGSAALAPGGMPVQAAPVPLADKNHYTFLFPIRPGETRFQISYHIPYSGKLSLVPRMATSVGTIALMLPKSMTFTPVSGNPYQSVSEEVTAQTFVARGVTTTIPLGFTLTGTGQLPRDTQNPDAPIGTSQAPTAAGTPGADTSAPVPATDNKMPGKGLDNPLDPEGTHDTLSKYKYWILAGLGFLIVACVGILLGVSKQKSPQTDALGSSPKPTQSTQHDQLLNALKEQLFSLETDRLQNTITEDDYLAQKAAIELILRRALNRSTPLSQTA